jgi:hypothetical protein
MLDRNIRVLHCPTMTGGNAQQLARAERSLGLESWSVAFSDNYLSYQCDELLWEEPLPLIYQQWRCWKLLLRAAKKYDVVHYNAGTSILPWDFSSKWAQPHSLKSLVYKGYANWSRFCEQQLLKKQVVAVTYQGDDARQGDYTLANFPISIAQEVKEDYYSEESDAKRRRKIAWFDEYADLIYALNPDLLWVLPKRAKFLPYANVDISSWLPITKAKSAVPLVLHAPSHRGAKGTRFLIDAVTRLKAEGVAFEFILVENMSNAEARKLYERADIVVDQLLAGWYGGFAVELMALGKPVICYLRQGDLGVLPPEMSQQLPLIQADPDSIYTVLRDWLLTPNEKLTVKGYESRSYVEAWHDPIKIAAILKDDYYRAGLMRGFSWANRSVRV